MEGLFEDRNQQEGLFQDKKKTDYKKVLKSREKERKLQK